MKRLVISIAAVLLLLVGTCTRPPTAKAFTTFDVAFDFRATVGYVTDPSYAKFIGGTEIYPTTSTINGFSVTYGWDDTLNQRDRDNTVDARLAGINFNKAGTQTFRVDLPSTGTYNIFLAIGDAANGSAQTSYVTVVDNATTFINFNPVSTSGTQYADAAGNFWSKTTWAANNVAVSRTFGSTILKLTLSDGGAGAASCLAHLRITQSGGGATPTCTLSTMGAGPC